MSDKTKTKLETVAALVVPIVSASTLYRKMLQECLGFEEIHYLQQLLSRQGYEIVKIRPKAAEAQDDIPPRAGGRSEESIIETAPLQAQIR